jgi:hypothetical protein
MPAARAELDEMIEAAGASSRATARTKREIERIKVGAPGRRVL